MISDGQLKGKKRTTNHKVRCDILQRAKQQRTMKASIDILLTSNPHLKSMQICKLMDWDYLIYGKTVTQRRYEWRKSQGFGVGSQGSKFAPDSQHHCVAEAFVPVFLDRKKDHRITELALKVGWILSKNPNKELIWNIHSGIGRIRWWETGRVRVHVKKPHHLGRVKKLVSIAFFQSGLILNEQLFSDFVDQFEWKETHDVYFPKEKKRLPYLNIQDPSYQRLGIRSIRIGDKSHPYGVEIEYVRDPIFEQLRAMMEINQETFVQFTKFMKDLSQPNHKEPKDSRKMYI
jgi:hypothetical protein